jgi:hypothetical protein
MARPGFRPPGKFLGLWTTLHSPRKVLKTGGPTHAPDHPRSSARPPDPPARHASTPEHSPDGMNPVRTDRSHRLVRHNRSSAPLPPTRMDAGVPHPLWEGGGCVGAGEPEKSAAELGWVRAWRALGEGSGAFERGERRRPGRGWLDGRAPSARGFLGGWVGRGMPSRNKRRRLGPISPKRSLAGASESVAASLVWPGVCQA